MRVIQGFSLGGEFTGSMVYRTEKASRMTRGLISSSTAAGTTIGFILGSASLAGGTAPLVSTWLLETLHMPLAPALYIIAYGVIGLALMWPMEETNTRRLDL